MSLEDFEDNVDPKTRRYASMKSIMDIGMGIIYIGVAMFLLFAKKFNINIDFVNSIGGKIFAVGAIIYGAWRIYRGIKKDYFIER